MQISKYFRKLLKGKFSSRKKRGRKKGKFKCKIFSNLFNFNTIGCKNRSLYARIEDIDYVLTTSGIHQSHSFMNLSVLLSIIFRFNRYVKEEACID